jgi:hypothetical protein
MTPTFEHQAILYVVIGGMFLLNAAVAISTLIVNHRRKPPLEAEYATKAEVKEGLASRVSKEDCRLKDQRVLGRDQLEQLFLTRREWELFESEFRRSEKNAENFRTVFNVKLDRQGKLLVALAVKQGVEIEEEA